MTMTHTELELRNRLDAVTSSLETELSVIEVPKGQLRFVSELRELNLQIRYNHS